MQAPLERVSTGSAGQANEESRNASISADGRYVAFESYASNLVAGDANNIDDVFVKDLLTGTTTLVSTDSAGQQADGYSYGPSISAGGRFVAFTSYASNLVAGDSNDASDVFVKDLQTGLTTLVSTNSVTQQANGGSNGPSISADGRYVAFQSDASNLVTGDSNGGTDVFVRDLVTGTTSLVSTNNTGEQTNSWSYDPSISADGRYVAFYSYADNLVVGDSNSGPDVFVKDLLTGAVIRASTDSTGQECSGESYGPTISADGRFVAFESLATTLVAGDTNDKCDVFVKDLAVGVVLTRSDDTDQLIGGAGSDSLDGAAGRDTLIGSGGDDTLSGGSDMDHLDGGAGNDTADFTHATAPAAIDLVSGIVDYGPSGVETIVSIENIIGSNGANTIIGRAGANRLDGAGGHDTIVGGGGDDTLIGGSGNDALAGGLGVDRLDGGSGSDTADFSHSTASVTIDLLAGTVGGGDGGIETLISIENVVGGSGTDTIVGTSGANHLDGGIGSDSLDGAAGRDTLIGGDGDDTLSGGSDIDHLDGGAGNDTADFTHATAPATIDLVAGIVDYGDSGVETIVSIENVIGTRGANVIGGTADANRLDGAGGHDAIDGGAGDDTLIGGSGNDIFRFGVQFGNDTILDFDANGYDRLEFDDALGIASFSAVDLDGNGVLETSDLGVTVADGSTTLVFDGNTLVIAGETTLTEADFLFY